MAEEQLLLLPLWYVVFLLSVTCHEAGHAWAARLGGDDTAYLGGQVSLNPLPHIQRELWGTVLIPLLSFLYMGWMMGWASAPYDPYWEDRYPRRAAAMAAAGPAANLVLAVLGFVVLKIGLGTGVWQPPESLQIDLDQLVIAANDQATVWNGLARFGSVLFSLNVVLLLFNLIPVPPLDGASVIAGLFEPARRLRDRLRSNPMGGLVGLLIAWYLFPKVFGALFFGIVFGALYS
jgi:Zn-dependent protease